VTFTVTFSVQTGHPDVKQDTSEKASIGSKEGKNPFLCDIESNLRCAEDQNILEVTILLA
jgi:hypothetical protein